MDIDLNLSEPLSRDELEAIRPRFLQAFEAVFRREGFAIRKSPTEHAGGKLSALFSRVQARDLFDAHQLLTKGNLDCERLRVAFVVYGGFNRVDWRTIDLDRLDLNPTDVERMLVPTVQPSIVDEAGGSSR